MTEMREVLINNRWPLKLPEHRAARPQWTTPPYWEAERLNHMRERLKPGMVIVDVGSEEGDLSALYASWGCNVVLVEPNERVWPNPKAIWEANNLPIPVATFSGFAGEFNREVAGAALQSRGLFFHSWPISANGEVIHDHGFAQLNERPDLSVIRLDTLESLLAKEADESIAALTVDTEGSEFHVLRGAQRLLQEVRPLVWFSSHPDFQRIQYGYTEAELLAFLDSVGYRYELIAEDHERHFFAEPK